MLIIRYRGICEIWVWELVPGQGAVTKYLDEGAGVLLSSMPIVHRAVNHSVPRYVVTSILDGFINISATKYYDQAIQAYRVTQKNLQNLLLTPIRDVPPSCLGSS